MQTLIEKQVDLEYATRQEAEVRRDQDNLKTNKRKAWSESKLGISYTKAATTRFVSHVADFMNQPAQEGRRMNRAAEHLRRTGVEPEVVAYLFTKALFNLLALTHRRRLKRVSLCIKSADLIHDEWRIRYFAQTDKRKALLRKLFKDFDKRTYPREWRKRTITNYFHAEQLEWKGWETKDKLHVGYALLVLFKQATGMVEMDGVFVDPTEELFAHVQDTLQRRVLDFMIYKPMVVPPRPWGMDYLFRGGYISNNVKRYPIIKGARRRDVERFMNMDWSNVIPSLNALQETPWRVNHQMLDMLDWCMYERGGDFAGLPPLDPKPLPPLPFNYRTDEAVKKEHDKRVFLIRSENREIISKRLMILNTITIAKQYRNFKALYFPHNMDTRGRAYPLPAFLNPQGPDSTKALLEFGRGKPITDENQAGWLAIAGANAYGKDKVSLAERVAWVEANHDMIISIAENPKGDLRWTEASEPFQFLRFCIEWSDFFKTGFGFVSHMVVPVDATCSGLQHYSAMLRDEIGGRSVNLVPGLSRQDIYQDVADKVIEALMADVADPTSETKHWSMGWIKFGIDRKITKRQVMVVPYAGTFASCMEYTREAVKEKLKEGHIKPWNSGDAKEENDRIVHLSKLIWNAIDLVVVKGKEAMRWLSTAAAAYTKWANKHMDGDAFAKRMTWVTPDGFEAIHWRADEAKNRVVSYLDGRVQLAFYEETQKLNSKDMALAVAPNFVHSMDACLLRVSIMRALAHGLSDFGMIHDSFGVHAADMDTFLSQCVKPAFIDMYQNDVLAQFKDRLPVELDLEPLPEQGSLDLEGVLNSEFFFS